MVLFAVIALAVIAMFGGMRWAQDASPRAVVSAILGAILGLAVALFGHHWALLQDAKRIERRHIREYHSEDPKP